MLRKRITLLQRRADLSHEEFDRHWRGAHADIVTELPGLQAYVQNTVRRSWRGEETEPLDGVVEVWFDDAAVGSPDQHSSDRQREDELAFLGCLTAFTVENREVYDAAKKIWVLRGSEGDVAFLDRIDSGRVLPPNPEEGTRLMERPRLRREPRPPAVISVVLPGERDAGELFDDVARAMGQAPGAETTRVLLTETRRIV